jgi:hypothetical protein
VTKNQDLKRVKKVIFETFDPNTEKLESIMIDVDFSEDQQFNSIIGKLCAQNHLNHYKLELNEQVEISKQFEVMHSSTSLIAKLKLKNAKISPNEMES